DVPVRPGRLAQEGPPREPRPVREPRALPAARVAFQPEALPARQPAHRGAARARLEYLAVGWPECAALAPARLPEPVQAPASALPKRTPLREPPPSCRRRTFS